jgi:stage V sporulation protein AB
MNWFYWLKEGLLFFVGICSGGMVAAGVFSFIVSIGALSRIIGKSHTGDNITLYEYFMAAGITLGNIISIYHLDMMRFFPGWTGVLVMGAFGLFTGIFVGVLIMSLAETLNVLPVFARNMHMKEGLKYIIAAMAAGKLTGAWLDFWIER